MNEITDITETTGPSWVTPAYSKAGNMTTIPQPADPTSSYTATYDAWNRLVKLVDGANTVSEYEYDGAKRRTIQKSYISGTLDETRHLYYTDPSKWQVIEERVDTSSDPEQQHVWGLRYIDDCVLRDRDTTANGTLNERLYGMQDANWNVTALSNTSGAVQERYAYSAYGTPMFLTASFGIRTASSFDWETLYAAYNFETQTGLFHVRHRTFDTEVGAWLQRDPLFMAAGLNLYQYTNSAPLNATDPSGLLAPMAIACLLGLGVGVTGSLFVDWWNNNLGVCRSSVQAFLAGILSCASAAILSNVVGASLFVMDALAHLGLGTFAAALWRCPKFRRIAAGSVGVGLGILAALAGAMADCICGGC